MTKDEAVLLITTFSKNFNAGLQYSPVVASDKYNGANNTLYRVLTNVKF